MNYLKIFLVVLVVTACNQPAKQPAENKEVAQQPSTGNFGENFSPENAVPASQVANLFNSIDTVEAVISGGITAACKHSGCWMDLEMGNGETIHVTFLNESFTIPLDAAGKNAVAQGLAIRELIPVESLQNYAREEGKSEEEVAAITEPAYAYEFIATGVLIN